MNELKRMEIHIFAKYFREFKIMQTIIINKKDTPIL